MKHKPFSPFDTRKRKKPLTRKQLKHLYEAALENDELLKAEIKNGDFEKF